MKFVNPRNAPASTERVPYWDANRTAGLVGAIPPAKVLNDIQDEILKVITQAGLTPDPNDPTQLWQALSTLLAAVIAGTSPPISVPTGGMMPFAGPTAPGGWLKCNGQAVSRATVAALFAVIGTTYGAGDAVTTFNVPDLRGEGLRGLDEGRGIDTGRALGTWQDWSTGVPKTVTAKKINDDGSISATLTQAGNPSPSTNPSRIGFVRRSKTGERVVTGDFDPGGGGNPYIDIVNVVTGDDETRMRNVAVPFIIKT